MIENKKAKNELKVGLGEINFNPLDSCQEFHAKNYENNAKNIVNY